jgi:hypothetical protein
MRTEHAARMEEIRKAYKLLSENLKGRARKAQAKMGEQY